MSCLFRSTFSIVLFFLCVFPCIASTSEKADNPGGQLALSEPSLSHIHIYNVAISKASSQSTKYRNAKPKIVSNLTHGKSIDNLFVSSDGNYLYSDAADGTIKQWDIRKKYLIRTIKPDYSLLRWLQGGASPRVVSFDMKKGLQLWNVEDGTLLLNIKYDIPKSLSLEFITSSYDGKYIILKTQNINDPGKWLLYNSVANSLQSLALPKGWKGCCFPIDGEAGFQKFLALNKDKIDDSVLQTLRYKYKNTPTANRALVDYHIDSANGRPSIVVSSGQKPIVYSKHSYRDTYIAGFSPDTTYAISHSCNNTELCELGGEIHVWEVATGVTVWKGKYNGNFVVSDIFSPDMHYLFFGNNDGSIDYLDIKKGRLYSLIAANYSDSRIVISNDRELILNKQGHHFTEWNINEGRLNRIIKNDAADMIYSEKNKGYYSFNRGKISAVDHKGKTIRTINDSHAWRQLIDNSQGNFDLEAINIPDIMTLSGNGEDLLLSIWRPAGTVDAFSLNTTVNLNSGKMREFNNKFCCNFSYDEIEGNKHTLTNNSVCKEARVDVNETKIFSNICSQAKFDLSLHDAVNGAKDKTYFSNKVDGFSSNIFTRNKDIIIFSINDYYADTMTTSVADIQSGRVRYSLSGHEGNIERAVISGNDRIITKSDVGNIDVWNQITGQLLATFVANKQGDWIVITPEGFFNASNKGVDILHVVKGLETFPVSTIYDAFYRPDIVKAKLAGENISKLIGGLTLQRALESPAPEVKIALGSTDSNASELTLNYEIKSKGGGIGEISVYQNGKLVYTDGSYRVASDSSTYVAPNADPEAITRAVETKYRGLQVNNEEKGKPNLIRMAVAKDCDPCIGSIKLSPIPGEESQMAVIVKNRDGTISSMPATTRFKSTLSKPDPHLWVLAIGINQFNNINHLVNARKDAEDFSNVYLKKSTSLFKSENLHLISLLDDEATKKNILLQLDAIAKKAQPGDTFVWFVASHGIMDGNGVYGIVPVDLKCLDDGCTHVDNLLNSNEILEASSKIPAMKQLLVLDTCHAGGLNENLSGLYDARMSVLAKNMGLHFYASSSATEQALDGNPGQNGLFTESLLASLNGKARDDDNNQFIGVIELGKYTRTGLEQRLRTRYGEKYKQSPKFMFFGQDSPVYRIAN